jgi:Zn-dependent protease with chaperone function
MVDKKSKKMIAIALSMGVAVYALIATSLPIMLVLSLISEAIFKHMPTIGSFVGLVILLSPIALIVYKYKQLTSQPILDLIQNNLAPESEIYKIDHSTIQTDANNEKIRMAFLNAATQLKMDVSKIALLKSNQDMFNAFALSNNQNEGAIIVFDGLVNSVDDQKLQAVIGHELGHIQNKDSLHKIAIFASQYYIPASIDWNDRFLAGIHNFALNFRNLLVTLFTSLILLAFRIQAWLLMGALWLNRFVIAYAFKQSEYLADQIGSQASSKEAMASVLADIDQLEQQSGAKPSALYALLAEHPRTADRIKHIHSL